MATYIQVASEDYENDAGNSSETDLLNHLRHNKKKISCWAYLLVLPFTHLAAFWAGHRMPLPQLEHVKALTTWCLHCSSSYPIGIMKLTSHCPAPLHESLSYRLHFDKLNATTWTDTPSLWRAYPSPEGDHLWEQNWNSHPMLIPASDMQRLDQDPDYVARWPDDPNLVMVGSQAHHLLHCVDVLRKAVWTDHYWPKGNINPGHRTHQTHCVDLLRQDLMCRAPMDVYPLIWMDGESQPTPNFNVSLKCSDWNSMSSWWRERQMTDAQVKRLWVKPSGVKQWPAPGGLKEEKAALAKICSRPDIKCTIGGEELTPASGILS